MAAEHGFALWRSTFVIISVIMSCVAIIVEFIFNEIEIKLKHIILPIFGFGLYIGCSAIFSMLL